MRSPTTYRQPPQTQNYPAPIVSRAKLRHLGLKEGFSVADWSKSKNSSFRAILLHGIQHISVSTFYRGFPAGSAVKNLPAIQKTQETRVQSLGGEDTLEEYIPTPVFLLGKFPWTEEPGPWVPKELDTTAATDHAYLAKNIVLPMPFAPQKSFS